MFKMIARNSLAVVLGIVIGSVVNMGIINVGSFIVPLPAGADVSTMENLRESMKLFTPLNFLVPFAAHALGTLVGAFVAAKLASSYPMRFAIGIGCFFLLGGVTAVLMVGAPVWFNVTDLLLAYLPMGYLGGFWAGGSRTTTAHTAVA